MIGDFNSEYSKLANWMVELGLVDLMALKYGDCPKTYMRSQNTPPDCIFGSANLHTSNGGFLAFHKLISDHRGVCIDISKYLLYEYNPPSPFFSSARRLKLNDPRVVKRYIIYLRTAMKQHDLFNRMNELYEHSQLRMSPGFAEEYERIDNIVSKLMSEAELQCRKLRMVPTLGLLHINELALSYTTGLIANLM